MLRKNNSSTVYVTSKNVMTSEFIKEAGINSFDSILNNFKNFRNLRHSYSFKNFVEKLIYVDTLDNSLLSNSPPNDDSKHYFLKIDTEGAEPAVLRGGGEFLVKQKVIGFFEYSSAWTLSKETLKDTFYFLDNLGYSLFRITPFGLEHIRFFHKSLETYKYQNIFFSKHSFVKEYLKSIEIPFEFSKTDLFLFDQFSKPTQLPL